MKLGQKIFYTGDAANLEGFGAVVEFRPNTWENLIIKMDDGRKFIVGEPHFAKGPGRRFMTIEDYHSEKKEKMKLFEAMISKYH